MDNAELAKKLSEKSHLDEQQAEEFIAAFSEVMGEYFKKGEKVVIAEFGSFYVGEDKKVQFNPSAKLKEVVT
jgi:nucleoid DNA-binding protein